jgi:hypothetical protein
LIVAAGCLAFALSACSVREGTSDAETDADAADAPMPEYAQQDGDLYMYVGLLSEEAKARGESTPVVTYRFLGMDGDVYRLELVEDDGSRATLMECSDPCNVVKSTDRSGLVTRIAADPGTILAAAFRDARLGLLTPSSSPTKASPVPIAPEPEQPPEIEKASVGADWRGKRGKCRLRVSGTSYISGDCWIRMEGEGSFQIMSLDEQYFAQLLRSEGEAMGHWNETPGSTHAHSSLGVMTRAGGCWKNADAEICAWDTR